MARAQKLFHAIDHPQFRGMGSEYDVLVADPCFRYARAGGVGSADRHYATMSLADLKDLPVQKLASANSVLLLWAAGPKLDDAIELMRAWGFHYTTVFCVWVKTNKHSESSDLADAQPIGLGSWTLPCTEMLLAGTIGQPLKMHKQKRVDQLLVAPRRGHSEKPPEMWPLIADFFKPTARVIELFARAPLAHTTHDAWGLEVEERTGERLLGDISTVAAGAAPSPLVCKLCRQTRERDKFYAKQKAVCKLCYIRRQKETNARRQEKTQQQ